MGKASAPKHAGIARRHQFQFVITQPVVMFFSATSLAAASLTSERSPNVGRDPIRRKIPFLPSQVWMRKVRVPS
jgi:hypothetical protein